MASHFTNLKTEFASLSGEEFLGQWSNIELGSLEPSEQEVITSFHKLACVTDSDLEEIKLDESNVLLVRAQAGFLQDVYAASLRQSEGQLVVKLGSTLYPVSIQEEKRSIKIGSRTKEIKEQLFVCGELFGKLEFADGDPSKATVKIDGAEVDISYTRCWIDLSDAETSWRVQIGLDLTKLPNKQIVLDSLDAGTLAEILKPAVSSGGSGGEAVGMQDLGEGLFDVAGYRQVNTENGDRFIIQLSDERECWSRGNVDKQLRSDEQRRKIDAAFAAQAPVQLAVGNITRKETKDGEKVYLDCALRFRAVPVVTETEAETETETASVSVKPVIPATASEQTAPQAKSAVKKQPAVVGAVTAAPTTGEVDFDEIPF